MNLCIHTHYSDYVAVFMSVCYVSLSVPLCNNHQAGEPETLLTLLGIIMILRQVMCPDVIY